MSEHIYTGRCTCGQANFQIRLSRALNHYTPRACDCDFCQARHIAYLSDPEGTGTIFSEMALVKQKQGSQQADFLTCPECEDVLAASCTINGQLRGAVNANLLDSKAQMNDSQEASPKHLSAAQKNARWADIWLCLSLSD